MDRCCDFIEAGLAGGGTVYVHCGAGISRSATMAAAYLMRKEALSAGDAVLAVRAARPFARPNDGFMRQLGVYEEQLRSRGSGGGQG
mmetsp:Transcript_45308/g.144195  ORF Transcript_45308/g.144195 Transcript_45308/m.144195 type:complete len:87 (+) Transcript_45308:213-473(+)